MVNDVMYHNVTEKLYAVGTQKTSFMRLILPTTGKLSDVT